MSSRRRKNRNKPQDRLQNANGQATAHRFPGPPPQGNVTDVVIVSSDSPRYFDRPVIAALKLWKFRAEGEKYVAEIEVIFVLKE